LKPIIENPAERTASVRWALASLSLSMLMPSLDTSIANAGLPTLAQAFTASFQSVQWIVLAYLLAITTLIVSVGRIGDIIGQRRLLLFGIGLFTVASLLCGIAPTLWLLIAARATQGLGAAIMMALTVALVGETVPTEKIGSAMGLLGTMSAIGTTLGPSLGGLLIAGLGWQSIFLVNVPLGILNFLLAHRYLPVDRQEPKTDRSAGRRADWSTSRSHCRPFWRTTHDHRWTDWHRDWLLGFILCPSDIRHCWIHHPDRLRYRQLCTISGC
jgi:MFS family permease